MVMVMINIVLISLSLSSQVHPKLTKTLRDPGRQIPAKTLFDVNFKTRFFVIVVLKNSIN